MSPFPCLARPGSPSLVRGWWGSALLSPLFSPALSCLLIYHFLSPLYSFFLVFSYMYLLIILIMKYFTCWRTCRPRGRHLRKRGATAAVRPLPAV